MLQKVNKRKFKEKTNLEVTVFAYALLIVSELKYTKVSE